MGKEAKEREEGRGVGVMVLRGPGMSWREGRKSKVQMEEGFLRRPQNPNHSRFLRVRALNGP